MKALVLLRIIVRHYHASYVFDAQITDTSIKGGRKAKPFEDK